MANKQVLSQTNSNRNKRAKGKNKYDKLKLPVKITVGIKTIKKAKMKFMKLSNICDDTITKGEIEKLLKIFPDVTIDVVDISQEETIIIQGKRPPSKNKE
jgi:uncharacterized protein YPO0396